MSSGHLYLLADDAQQLYKIGTTRGSVENRVKKLQTGNGWELRIVEDYECEYPFRLESMLHSLFESQRYLNEWYMMSKEDVEKFHDTVVAQDNLIQALKTNPFFAKNLH